MEILKLLWNFTSVQQRMIPQESRVTRQAECFPSLQHQSVLVDRLVLQADAMNQDINPVKDRLLTSLSGGSIIDQYG